MTDFEEISGQLDALARMSSIKPYHLFIAGMDYPTCRETVDFVEKWVKENDDKIEFYSRIGHTVTYKNGNICRLIISPKIETHMRGHSQRMAQWVLVGKWNRRVLGKVMDWLHDVKSYVYLSCSLEGVYFKEAQD